MEWLFNKITQTIVKEIETYNRGMACVIVMSDEKPDRRAANVSFSTRKMDIVKRIHLVTTGRASCMILSLDTARDNCSHGD
ncbi:hypothetical protein RRF57_009617 [Xylaria bambusicola]|uniref:Uncharacterized protein n=1 Tax=Xylaria bambusicola TaxID=326684 RepID=A0AAN7UV94_9PEZI